MFATFDHVKEQPTLVLSYRPFIIYGDVVLVYGEGEVGKGRMVMSAVGAITRGDPVGLDIDGDEPGDVILIMGEDKPGEHVVGRLIAEGADLRRVHNMSTIDGVRFKFSASAKNAGHMPILRSYIDQLRRSCLCGAVCKDIAGLQAHLATFPGIQHAARNPRMVVGDPITSLIAQGGTIQTNAGARAFLEPIQDMADQTGVAVVLVAHPTKGGKVMQGSGALRDAARVVLFIHWDDVNKSHRVVEVEKGNNLSEELRRPIKYTIETSAQGRPFVSWLGAGKQEAAGEDWRAALSAQKGLRASMQAQLAVATTKLPDKPGSVSKPWRVLSWHHAADGTDTPGIVGDEADEAAARQLAVNTAGCILRWSQDDAGRSTSSAVRDDAGGVSMFVVYRMKNVMAGVAALCGR